MLPPGPAPRKELGLNWLFRPYAFLRECAEQYGDAFTVELGSYGRFVLFSHPDAIRQIFTGDTATFHAGAGNRVLRPFLGDASLMVLEEARHLEERRLLLPAFHAKRADGFQRLIGDATLAALRDLMPGQVVNVQELMQTISLDVIQRAVFGGQDDVAHALRQKLHAFLNDAKFNLALIGELGDELDNEAWSGFREVLKQIHELIDALIERRRAEGPSEHSDMLALLLEARRDNGQALQNHELRDELLTLVVTGYETTATALAWAIYWLVKNQSVGQRLLEELSKPVAAAAPNKPDYLDAVCSEVLRISPVIPLVAREVRAPVEIGGFDIELGVTVAPCIYLTHQRPELYPNPDVFRPERFLERSYGPYEYLPFGGGARRCLGRPLALWEMKSVLSALWPRFELELVDPEQVRPQRRSVTVAPAGGPAVRLGARRS